MARCLRHGAGVAVALADKLDTLAGIFAIGQKPSGTKDPVRPAARRHRRAANPRRETHRSRPSRARDARLRAAARAERGSAAGEVWDYMVERLRAYFLDSGSAGGVAGVTTEMFDAVRASSPVSPLDFAAQARGARQSSSGLPRRRVSPRPTSASPTSSRRRTLGASGAVDVAALREPAEKALHEALAGIVVEVERALAQARLQRGTRASRDPASRRSTASSTA